MSSLLGFVSKWNGRYLSYPGGVGGQCVDLSNEYVDEVRGLVAVRQNAVDWRNVTLSGAQWVVNSLNNYPSPGDLVVWASYPKLGISKYGHIAVAVLADPMWLVTFDQDWPVNAPCKLTVHEYGGVVGWHHFTD